MGSLTGRIRKGHISGIILVLLLSLAVPVYAQNTTDDNIIFNGPFFENYGKGFTNWSGNGQIPSGTLRLQGSLSVTPDEVMPGDEVEFTLDLSVSAMTITGKEGAVLKTSQDRLWSVDTTRFMDAPVEFTVIPDGELLGVGIDSPVPDLILRDTKRMKTVKIPETAKPGVYQIRAVATGSDLRTGPVTLTITNQTGEIPLNNTSVTNEPVPTPVPTPEVTPLPEENEEQQQVDPRFAGMSEKIVNERNLHVTSVYPYSGGVGNTMGIKIYGDHFAPPVYVTLVKDNTGIEGNNYCFEENQKYGVVMIPIPPDTEQGTWNLVVTTKDGKATIPFEVTDKLIEPEILNINAPLLTPDEGRDITITGKQLMEPCDILLAGEGMNWFSFSPKPVLMHNTLKIRVKINVPLSDEVTSGLLDLVVWNGDGATTTYDDAVSFAIEKE